MAMGAQTLNHFMDLSTVIEHNHITYFSFNYHIKICLVICRFVYNDDVPDISVMLCEYNDASPKSHFTYKLVHNKEFNSIITIFTKNNNSIQTSVNRGYIANTCNTPNDSRHQVEHKVAGVRSG
jgi:hypothetical protein